MKKEIIGTGKTVELAIQAALEQLEKSRDEVEVEILELPKKASFFGLIKGSEAKVKVTFSQSKAVVAQDFVKRVLDAMGIQNQVAIKEDGDNVVLSLGGEDIGAVIGRRGGTLDALQYLTGLVANRMEGGYCRITLDCENYREKREKTLEALARRLSLSVARTGRPCTLEPMNPYERRVIHSTVQKVGGATSTSIGEEPNRRVVISPLEGAEATAKPLSGGERGRRPYQKNSRQGGLEEQVGSDRLERRERRDRGPRRDRPRQEPIVSTKPVTDEAADKPLYSKIEIE